MIYRYVKCESVIAKIMADTDASEIRNRVSDIREWIFEAIEKIGAPMQYVRKESGIDGPLLEIQDHQVPIPCDLVHLDAVAYAKNPNGPWVPVRKDTSDIHQFRHRPAPKPDYAYLPHDHANKTIPEGIHLPPEHQAPAHKLMTSQSQLLTMNGVKAFNQLAPNLQHEPTYFIKPGWIVTNQKHGFIKLVYKSIATDERGYPLIPDLASYQEAVYWYVMMKLSFPKFLKGRLGGRSVYDNRISYQYMQQQWCFYAKQAYAEAMMPTPDDMRSIKNDWLKLIPDVDADDFFFKPTGDRETTYNDNYYEW